MTFEFSLELFDRARSLLGTHDEVAEVFAFAVLAYLWARSPHAEISQLAGLSLLAFFLDQHLGVYVSVH